MPYSNADDLLTGDLLISQKVDKGKFVSDAAEEIDSKLGFIYVLPLTGLELHETLLLKQINNKLASGRLILTLDIAGEGTVLHAYGLRLITEAMNDLMLLANGAVQLGAPRTPLETGSRPNKTPKVFNHDEESAVDIFESAVMRRGETGTWQPGEVNEESVAVDWVNPNSGTLYGG